MTFSSQSMPKTSTKLTIYDALVSGSGPGGQAAAYELGKLGLSVLIVEKRSEETAAIRSQLVHLRKESTQYLQEMLPAEIKDPQDKVMQQKFKIQYDHYGLKDIQRFLNRRLEEQKKVHIWFNSELTHINLKEGLAEVQTSEGKKTIKFDYLIGADGAKHHAANILTKSGYPIEYEASEQHLNPYCISAYFSVVKKDGEEFNAISLRLPFEPAVTIVNKMGNGLIYFDLIRSKPHDTPFIKFCITHTVSKEFHEECNKNKNLGLNFLKETADKFFSDSSYVVSPAHESKKTKEKNAFHFSTFITKREQVITPAIYINNYLAVMTGDSLRTPDLYQGHGIRDAFLFAVKISNLISALRKGSQTALSAFIDEYKMSVNKTNQILKKQNKTRIKSFTILNALEDFVSHNKVHDLKKFLLNKQISSAYLFQIGIKNNILFQAIHCNHIEMVNFILGLTVRIDNHDVNCLGYLKFHQQDEHFLISPLLYHEFLLILAKHIRSLVVENKLSEVSQWIKLFSQTTLEDLVHIKPELGKFCRYLVSMENFKIKFDAKFREELMKKKYPALFNIDESKPPKEFKEKPAPVDSSVPLKTTSDTSSPRLKLG